MLDNNIAYIQLSTFGDKTTDDLKAKLNELLVSGPEGLILDLRYNGGGYLPTAVEVVSQFIKEGNALIEQYGDGTENAYPIISDGLATDIPLVVLVNEGTASAAEITAGAIQDYKRGTPRRSANVWKRLRPAVVKSRSQPGSSPGHRGTLAHTPGKTDQRSWIDAGLYRSGYAGRSNK